MRTVTGTRRVRLVRTRLLAPLLLMLASFASAEDGASEASPAEQQIRLAKAAIAARPTQAQPYNELALALARRARETSDASLYDQAREALAKSFALAPHNFEGRKIGVWLLLGKHEFQAAYEQAVVLNRLVPDDIQVYALLTDACIELGRYDEAERAAQWMLDLRARTAPGLTRAAYLRELYGDLEGAIELMLLAYQRLPETEVEDRAWVLTQLAHVALLAGKPEPAEQILQQALELFPQYHYALAGLAEVRIAQRNYSTAAQLLRQRYELAPHPENLYALAEALRLAGLEQDARQAFAEFEQKALAEAGKADNANRELIFLYADHVRRPLDALRLATVEHRRRQNVFTLDAYAWALFMSRRYSEAREQIDQALAVGVRDPRILYHAGMIAFGQGDSAAALLHLRQSITQAPSAPFSQTARTALAALENREKPPSD